MKPLLTAALFVTIAGCATQQIEPSEPVATSEASCAMLGERANQSPIEAQGGPIAVRDLRADDMDRYDQDESDLRPSAPVGARMSFAAPKGWTRQWLQHWVACYRDRNMGIEEDPLTYAGSEIIVRSARGAFVVDVIAEDPELARRIRDGASQQEQSLLNADDKSAMATAP